LIFNCTSVLVKDGSDEKDSRYSEAECWFSCFMMEEVHADESADGATDDSHREQSPFGNAPVVVTRFEFIDTVEDECQGVDG